MPRNIVGFSDGQTIEALNMDKGWACKVNLEVADDVVFC